MKKYIVRDKTMEKKGFENEYTSEIFNTYNEAINEILKREKIDATLGIHDDYYIEEI